MVCGNKDHKKDLASNGHYKGDTRESETVKERLFAPSAQEKVEWRKK